MKLKSFCVSFMVLLVAGACGRGGETLGLDRASPTSDDPRYDALRRRLNVDVLRVDLDFEQQVLLPQGCDFETGCTPSAFVTLAADACNGRVMAAPRCATAAGCEQVQCYIESSTCVAHTLLEVATLASPLRLAIDKSGGSILVPAQDAETNSELSRLAYRMASAANGAAGTELSPASLMCAGAGDLIAPNPGRAIDGITPTNGEVLARFYVEAYDVAIEAAHEMAAFSAAVADAQFARSGQIADAEFIATTAPWASRAAAAHLLVGGDPGLTGFDDQVAEEGLFPLAPPSDEGRHALQLLRSAAVSPLALRDPALDADDLMGTFSYGGGSDVGVAARLAALLADPEIAGPTASAADAYARLGISRQAFTEARSYLAAESLAFVRSDTHTAPPERLADGTMTAFPIFAGTRVEPRSLPASYLAAAYAYDATPLPPTSIVYLPNLPPDPKAQPGGTPDPTTGETSVSSFQAGAIITAQNILGAPALPADIADIIGGFVGTHDDVVTARIQACWLEGGSTDWMVLQIYGARSASDILLVTGPEGVQCATEGAVEGSPCDIRDYIPEVWPSTGFIDRASGPGTGFATFVEAWARVGSDTLVRGSASRHGIYAVERRAGVSSSLPGDYVELGGTQMAEPMPPPPLNSFTACRTVEITPDTLEDVERIVAPSPDDPARSDINCAGIGSGFHLPLENELTTDGDGVESSWRHYLQLAGSAADEADALGEDLIRTGLDMDLRAESAIDELERICGVSLNITSFAALESTPHTAPPVGGACPPGYRAEPEDAVTPTSCTLDPIAYARLHAATSADAARLDECLGADVNVPWATFGGTPLCIWHYPGVAASVCQRPSGLGSEFVCPVDLSIAAAGVPNPCDAALPNLPPAILGPNGEVVNPQRELVDQALGLFVLPSPDDQPPSVTLDPTMLPCELLAETRVRASGGFSGAVRGMLLGNGPLYDPDVMVQYARGLSWSPSAGDFSRVTFEGAELVSTGSSTRGVAGGWPCDGSLHPLCETNGSRQSFFCLQNACGTPMARAAVNDRLARAVLAARMVTGASLRGLRVPYLPRVVPDAAHTFTLQNPLWTTPRGTLAFQSAAVGNLHYTWTGSGSSQVRDDSLDELRVEAQRLQVVPGLCDPDPGIEWHGVTSAGFLAWSDGSASDCDPADDFGLPFLVRTLGDEADSPDAGTAVGEIWGRTPASHFEPLLGLFTHGPRPGTLFLSADAARRSSLGVGQLTRYWQYVNCADGGRPGADHGSLYNDCAAQAEILAGQDYRSLERGNQLFLAPNGLTEDDVFDGLELMCVGARSASPSLFAGCTDPPPIESVTDMLGAEQYVTCQRNSIRRYAAMGVIRDLPSRVVERLRSSAAGSFGETSGELGAEVTELRAAMIDLRTAEINMGGAMDSIATEIRTVRNVIAGSTMSRELEELSLASQIVERITQCATALLDAASQTAGAQTAAAGVSPAAFGSAAVSCGNSVAQIAIATRVRDLRDRGLELQDELAFINFEHRFNSLTTSMSEQGVAMQSALERIDAALTRIHNLERQGRTAAARALMLDDDGMGRHLAVDTTTRHRYSTVLARYRESHERAVRLAYVARIALEQRLGMPLASMADPLLTVDAPARWADEICTIPAIDYDRVRSSDLGTTGSRDDDTSPFVAPSDYSGLFVGDYVRRLEQVFESYSFAFPFREGTDTAVLSLRDDVFRVRERCARPVPNLILQAGHLDVAATTTSPGWIHDGCDALVDWPSGVGAPDRPACISPRLIDPQVPPTVAGGQSSDLPISSLGADFGGNASFRVEFGTDAPVDVGGGVLRQSITSATRLVQWTVLPAGTYRASWWGRYTPDMDASKGELIPPYELLRVVRATNFREVSGEEIWDEAEIAIPGSFVSGDEQDGGWNRNHFFFTVPAESTIGVVISPQFGTTLSHRVGDIAGIMVEDVSGVRMELPAEAAAFPPGPFFDTAETRTRELPVCEDIDGSTFRRDSFEYRCSRVCADGYDGGCPDEGAVRRCYYEASFGVDSQELQALAVGSPTGFAGGNYNYRFDAVGLNFVGTGLRDCTGLSGSTASTCYASGNVSYSLLHSGPFTVWNARGEDYEAPLFAGRIEGARGLAAERYLTNPLSGADRGLLTDFIRPDFQGRPLGGRVTLRIWNDAGVRFDRLEDVQIVLNYRYWQQQR